MSAGQCDKGTLAGEAPCLCSGGGDRFGFGWCRGRFWAQLTAAASPTSWHGSVRSEEILPLAGGWFGVIFPATSARGLHRAPGEPQDKGTGCNRRGTEPLVPHSLDHPAPKWLSQSRASHFEVLLWGDTLPTAQGQGSPYDQEKNPKRILPIIAKWQNFPPSGFRKFKGMKKVNLDSSNHFS